MQRRFGGAIGVALVAGDANCVHGPDLESAVCSPNSLPISPACLVETTSETPQAASNPPPTHVDDPPDSARLVPGFQQRREGLHERKHAAHIQRHKVVPCLIRVFSQRCLVRSSRVVDEHM